MRGLSTCIACWSNSLFAAKETCTNQLHENLALFYFLLVDLAEMMPRDLFVLILFEFSLELMFIFEVISQIFRRFLVCSLFFDKFWFFWI